MNERVNPFGDLGDFLSAQEKPKPSIQERAVIDKVAAENNFPSRQKWPQWPFLVEKASAFAVMLLENMEAFDRSFSRPDVRGEQPYMLALGILS